MDYRLNASVRGPIVIDIAEERTQSIESLRRYAPISDHHDRNG